MKRALRLILTVLILSVFISGCSTKSNPSHLKPSPCACEWLKAHNA